MKPAVFVHSWAPDEVLAELRRHFEVDYVNAFETGTLDEAGMAEHAAGKAGILVLQAPVSAAVMRANREVLKAVASVSVGVDNIDVGTATELGIQVTNTAGVLDDAVADMAMATMLAVARRVVEADRFVRAGRFQGPPFELFWGATVKGETLGIVGMGRIGSEVAKRARGFGLEILYHNRRRAEPAVESALGVAYASLEELLKRSKYVILLTPLTDETRHMIDAERLALMRADAFLVNISRGPVVDEAALLAALKAGRLAGAALDVYEFEPAITPGLTDLDNVVLTPHIGSATVETRHNMVRIAARNLIACLHGEAIPNPVNRPG